MSILAVGDEQDSYDFHVWVNASAFQSSTKGPDADYALAAVTQASGELRFSSVSECWLHFRIWATSTNSTTVPLFSLVNSSTGVDAFRVNKESGRLAFYYNSAASTYTLIGTAPLCPVDTNGYTLDFFFKRGGTGEVKMFFEKMLVYSTTGTFSTVDTTWDTLRLSSPSNYSNSYYGSVMVGDTPMIGYEMQSLKPNAAGNSSDWDGTYSLLATYGSLGNGSVNKDDAVWTNTVSEKFLANYESMSSLNSAQSIKAVCIAAMGSLDSGAAVSTVSFLVRHASTDYTLSSMGLSAGDGDKVARHIMSSNPASGAWSESDVNALQAGMISS